MRIYTKPRGFITGMIVYGSKIQILDAGAKPFGITGDLQTKRIKHD
jgi:hypothetical protein